MDKALSLWNNKPVRRMAFDKEYNAYVHADHQPEAELPPGIVVVGIHGPLFFADADNFHKSVMEMVEKDRPHSVVIDLSAGCSICCSESRWRVAGEVVDLSTFPG